MQLGKAYKRPQKMKRREVLPFNTLAGRFIKINSQNFKKKLRLIPESIINLSYIN